MIEGKNLGKKDKKVKIGEVGNIMRREKGNMGIGKIDVLKSIDGNM